MLIIYLDSFCVFDFLPRGYGSTTPNRAAVWRRLYICCCSTTVCVCQRQTIDDIPHIREPANFREITGTSLAEKYWKPCTRKPQTAMRDKLPPLSRGAQRRLLREFRAKSACIYPLG